MKLAATGEDSAAEMVSPTESQRSFLIKTPEVTSSHVAQLSTLFLSDHIRTSPVHFFLLFEQFFVNEFSREAGAPLSNDQSQTQALSLQRHHVVHKVHLVDGRIQVDRYTRVAGECDRELRQKLFGDMQYTSLLLKPRYYAVTFNMEQEEANRTLDQIKRLPSSDDPLWLADFAAQLINANIRIESYWNSPYSKRVVLTPYDVLRFESMEELGRVRAQSIAVGANTRVDPLTREVTSPLANQVRVSGYYFTVRMWRIPYRFLSIISDSCPSSHILVHLLPLHSDRHRDLPDCSEPLE